MKIKILSTLAVATMLFSGCQKEDNAPTIESSYPTDGVVRIATSINALQTRTATAEDYSGGDLSLSVDYSDAGKYTKTNVKWTKTAADGVWRTDEMMLWKNADTPTKVYAYAPHQDSQSDMTKVTFSAATNQSGSGGLTSSDLVL